MRFVQPKYTSPGVLLIIISSISMTTGQMISCNKLIQPFTNSYNQTEIKLLENVITYFFAEPSGRNNFTCEPKLNATELIDVYYPYPYSKNVTFNIMDNRFKLDAIFNTDTNGDIWKTNSLFLSRVNGFEIDKRELNADMFFLNFRFSHLDIYDKDKFLLATCDMRTFENFTFFRPFFAISFEKVTYNRVCPLVFNASRAREISFADITSSFLTRNELKFTQMTNVTLFRTDIFLVNFHVYYVRLNNQMLNEHLFKSVRELKFHHILTQIDCGGVSPTEERVKALKECATPTDVKSLRSFLCTALWSARFMKDICTIAEPLWRLTKNGMAWQWTTTEQNAFQALKDAISTKCMGYFRKDWAQTQSSSQMRAR